MDLSKRFTRRSSPDYDMKASPSRDSSSSDGVLMEPMDFSDHEKRLDSMHNGLSGIEVAPQAISDLQDCSIKSQKRKTIDSPLGAEDSGHNQTVSKKRKLEAGEEQSSQLPRDKALLSCEIWHRVFTFTPTRALGILLRVNKLFNIYLNSQSSFNSHIPVLGSTSCIKPLKPDTIWQLSRRLHWPKMPAPLRGRSELDMWRLCCSNICQRCGVVKTSHQRQESPDDPWHLGPGTDGLAAIFAFGVACCGHCLLRDSIKEIDLLLSSTSPSSLIPALTYIFMTNELHAVPPIVIDNYANSNRPETTKLYWVPSIAAAKEELQAAQQLGVAAVDEWLKGLDVRGRELRSDVSRWEKWAVTGGLVQMSKPLQLQPSGILNDSAQAPDSTLRASVRVSSGPSIIATFQDRQNGAPPPITVPEAQPLIASNIASQLGSPADTDRSHEFQNRPERTREEAAALKALRRADIERRAMLIDPPLPPNLLAHMPSFQAAIQITALLDDNAWNLLKPRLLAQRPDAEKKGNDGFPGPQTSSLEMNSRVPKEVSDKDWDDIQGPVRARMAKYADDIIRNSWGKGRKVNKESCPCFAAEVLLSVRAKFYADVAQDATAAIVAGQQPPEDPPEGPFTQKLTLENMKWVFDMKVKQHTESYRKDIFLCNGCDNNRFYGFEGVIQHYAAKHTKSLSLGNVVVHWRAEWPEQPLFKPNPRPTKPSHQGPLSRQQNHLAGPLPYHGYDGFYHSGNMPPAPPSYHFPTGHVPPSYISQYADPYAPSLPYHANSATISTPYLTPTYGTNSASQPYPPAPAAFGPYHPGPLEYLPSVPGPPYIGQHEHNSASVQSYPEPPCSTPQGAPFVSYRVQSEDLARSARDIWNTISSVRDLPGPLRIYVTIYHLVKRFRFKFSETPSLRMFNDGLSNNKEMRPVRNINGLMCKACTLGLGPYVNSGRKSFSLPQLVNHFENCHPGFQQVESQGQPDMDWTQDMVLLPEPSEVPDLRAILGYKGHKFNLISEAVPWVFNKSGKASHRSQAAWTLTATPTPGYQKRFPKQDLYSHVAQTGGFGDVRSEWPKLSNTRDTFSAKKGQDVQMKLPVHGFEEQVITTTPGSSSSSFQERDSSQHFDPLQSDFHRTNTRGSHSAAFVKPRGKIHYASDYPEGDGLSGRPSRLADEDRHFVHRQSQAYSSVLTESWPERDDRYCAEGETMVFRTPTRAESVGPYPVLGGDQMIPQNRRLVPLDGTTKNTRSAGVFNPVSAGQPPNESDDFSLTAALESHLAEDRDGPGQLQDIKPSVQNSGRQARGAAAHEPRPGAYHGRRQGVEYVNDAHQQRLIRQPQESYRTQRLSNTYKAAYIQNPMASQPLGRISDRREAAHPYAEEVRTSAVQYEEAYEIVHVRDVEGEYVVRRPIMRQLEPSRVLYDDDRCIQLDQAYAPSFGAIHESSVNSDLRPAPTRMQEPSAVPPRARNDLPFYEEYDPRNPVHVPSLGAGRDFGY